MTKKTRQVCAIKSTRKLVPASVGALLYSLREVLVEDYGEGNISC